MQIKFTYKFLRKIGNDSKFFLIILWNNEIFRRKGYVVAMDIVSIDFCSHNNFY
jgi:hypothetical protein